MSWCSFTSCALFFIYLDAGPVEVFKSDCFALLHVSALVQKKKFSAIESDVEKLGLWGWCV